jgi:hypothetical protein
MADQEIDYILHDQNRAPFLARNSDAKFVFELDCHGRGVIGQQPQVRNGPLVRPDNGAARPQGPQRSKDLLLDLGCAAHNCFGFA